MRGVRAAIEVIGALIGPRKGSAYRRAEKRENIPNKSINQYAAGSNRFRAERRKVTLSFFVVWDAALDLPGGYIVA